MHVSFSLYWMIVSKVHPGFVTVMKLSSVSGLLAIMINDQIGASVLKANTFFFLLTISCKSAFLTKI